jgi:ABC-type branched-subunit amino acid transport system permease subunit
MLFGGWSATVLAVVVGALLGYLAPQTGKSAARQEVLQATVSAAVASVLLGAGTLLYDLVLAHAAQLTERPQELAFLAAGLAVVLGTASAAIMALLQRTPDKRRVMQINILVFVAFLLVFPFVDQAARLNWLATLIFAEIYVLLALGLNIVVGFAGLLDLGYAAFFAIGAYTTGLLSAPLHNIHVNFWFLIWLSAGMAAIFGLMLGAPTLGLRGDYLAIVTLGFGEIVPVAAQQLIHITIKEPFTCWIIPAIQRLFGGQPATQCLVLADKFDLTAGVKGVSPLDRPVLPIITPTDSGLSLVVKVALMLAVTGIVAFVFMRARSRGNRSSRLLVTFGLILALIVLIFVPIPRPDASAGFVAAGVDTVLDTVQPGAFQSDNPVVWYFLVLGLVALSIFLIRRLQDSRLGRAWTAIREDELAANQMGINLVRTKLLAFSMGASFSGFAGAFYGAYVSGVFPNIFDFSVSVIVLCAVVLGGLGNITGVIFGALIILVNDGLVLKQLQNMLNGLQQHVLLPAAAGDPRMQEFIRANFDPVKYRFLLLGLVLVIVMAVRPEGLLPSRERREELHAAEEEPVAAAETDSAAPSAEPAR